MPRDARLLSKWRVFVSGVEIPHLGGNLTFGRNSYGQGSIQVEPDALVHDFRPNSKVHVFFFDRYGHGPPATTDEEDDESVDVEPTPGSGDPDDLLNNYRLLFEGELIGVGQSKSPNSRQMTLNVGGEFRTLQRSKMFQASVGGAFTTPLITGGLAVPEMVVDTGQGGADVLSLAALADNFLDAQSDALKEETKYYRTSTKPDFAERMIAMTAFMSSFSGALRLQTVRSRLINKIAGVPDQTLNRFMRLTLSNKVFQEAQGRITGQESVLDLLSHFCKNAFYSWYHIPGPYTPPAASVPYVDARNGRVTSVPGQPSSPEDVKLPENLKLTNKQGRGVFNFIRDFYRNDYLFLPELYFAMPPPCNFFFPDDNDSISYGRTFDAEPTRFVVTEPYFSDGQAAYFAPPWLLRNLGPQEQERAQSSEFYTANVAMFEGLKAGGSSGRRAEYDLASPYISPQSTGSNRGGINMLAVMTDDEIEKGILCSNTYHNMEFFSAISKTSEKRDELRREANFMKTEGELQNDYEHFMTELAMYRFLMENARREANVTVKGHTWCVPGFSAAIFDRDSVYLGFIEQVTFTWDVGANVESTNIGMSRVRHTPFQAPGGERQESLDADRRGQESVYLAFSEARESLVALSAEVGQALTRIKDALNKILKTENYNAARYGGSAGQQFGEGVSTLNKYGMLVAKSIYSTRPEVAQRYVEARPNLPSYVAGTSLDDVDLFGLEEYSKNHLPMFPQGYSRSAIYNDPENFPDVIYQATRLTQDIQDYVNFQIKQLNKAQEEGLPPDIDPVNRLKAAEVARKVNYSDPTTRQEIARLTGFFNPPSWFNQAFLRINTIDAVYQGLLGCQPFYSVFGETANPHADELGEAEAYHEYIRFLQALDKLYPFLETDSLIPSGRAIGEKAVWERLSEEDELSPGPHWWMSRRVQHRDITTMATFLNQNGLELATVVSSQPAPTVFYKMVPSANARQGKSKGDIFGYKFDNTIFSMIVDEWELFQRAGSTSDPAITQLKETARNPALTREYRQLLVERYSKKHFGARGYDGR